MSSSADLPRRKARTSMLEHLQQRLPRLTARRCVTSAYLAHHVVQARAYSAWVPKRYLRHVFIGLSVPATLLAGTVLPAARDQATAVPPVAAMYAAQAALLAPKGDLPVSEADAALAFGSALADGAAAEVVADTTLGHPVAAPVRVGSIVENNVNLREGPGTDAKVIAKLPSGTKLEVIGQRTGWYKVATAKGTVGWVVDDYFRLTTRNTAPTSAPAREAGATITADRVNLRQGPSTGHASYGKLAEGTSVEVLGRNNGWYKVRSPRGTIGWVADDLVQVPAEIARTIPVTTDAPPAPKPVAVVPVANVTPAQPAAAAVISGDAAGIAAQFVGARYVWGGASPSGFDCSGLALYVYKQLGLNLPHKASMQYNTPGQRIGSLGDLAPGDLVFFVRTTPAKGITHVGIYVGDGMMVTAGTTRTGVQRVSVYGQYWQSRFAGGVRPSR